MAQHLELELAVPVNKLGIGKKVKPIVDGLIERTQEPVLPEGSSFQHFLRIITDILTPLVKVIGPIIKGGYLGHGLPASGI